MKIYSIVRIVQNTEVVHISGHDAGNTWPKCASYGICTIFNAIHDHFYIRARLQIIAYFAFSLVYQYNVSCVIG